MASFSSSLKAPVTRGSSACTKTNVEEHMDIGRALCRGAKEVTQGSSACTQSNLHTQNLAMQCVVALRRLPISASF
jgi:hypothetical protein